MLYRLILRKKERCFYVLVRRRLSALSRYIHLSNTIKRTILNTLYFYMSQTVSCSLPYKLNKKKKFYTAGTVHVYTHVTLALVPTPVLFVFYTLSILK